MFECVRCQGKELYEFEFRTDYVKPRIFNPINEGIEENPKMPYRFIGVFCMDCGCAETIMKRGN